MTKVWKSKISRKTKLRLFQSTVESVLLYGSETWTLNQALEKSINGCYTRLLRAALNVNWQQHISNEELYGDLPPVSVKIKKRRLRLAGHCVRHIEEEAEKVVLWEPRHGKAKRGRPAVNYINILKADTQLEDTNEIRSVMLGRNTWKDFVDEVRDGSRPK